MAQFNESLTDPLNLAPLRTQELELRRNSIVNDMRIVAEEALVVADTAWWKLGYNEISGALSVAQQAVNWAAQLEQIDAAKRPDPWGHFMDTKLF